MRGPFLSHLESNLSLLAVRQPELAGILRGAGHCSVRVFPSACGLQTACWERDGSSLALHSRYDPLREARQQLKTQSYANADYFIFLGFGLGYLLDAVIEEINDTSKHYFIVESSQEILRAAFEARDLSSILSLPHVYFAWPNCGPELAEQWRGFFDPVQARQSTFLMHLPSVSLNPELFKTAAEIIQSQTFQIFTDINTLVAKSQEFLDNFVQNLPKAARAPGVISFAGMFRGTPAVIISAGPSLDKNIHELRGYEDSVLMLSTDTALKPLLAAGIDPHFVLTGDPSYANYMHLKGAPSRQALLVAEATSYPQVFGEFEEKTITCIFENSSLRSLSDFLGNKGTIRAWGSVATMALDFALLLGCNPIVFIGQDLAHTDGRIYCSGVYFDEEWFADISNPEEWQQQLQKLRSARRTITMEDIHGNPIESTDKLASYWNWILKVLQAHPETRFINATEGGILRDHLEIASLKETLHRCCSQNRDLKKTVRGIFEEAQAKSLLYSGMNPSVFAGEIAALQDALKRGFQLCEGHSYHLPEALTKRLEDTKDSIYYNPHLAPLVDCLNQMGNFNFLRRRRAFSGTGATSDLVLEIKEAYLEYFVSVQQALDKIRKALSQIEANLFLEPALPLPPAPPENHRNRYSRKPGLTIS
jgi:hypothetical protein